MGLAKADKSNFALPVVSSIDTHRSRSTMSKPEQQPTEQPGKGPHSSEHSTQKDDLGFDPDSPDVDDPQVDPQGPAKPPRDFEKKQ